MKYCERPFNFMWVTRTFDGKERSMTLPCSWLNIMGPEDTDLYKYSVDEVWTGDTFEKVRDSIIDGSFRYCNCATCPFLTNDSLPDLSEEDFKEATKREERPTHFDLAYDRTCNHACPSCRNEIHKNTPRLVEENEVIGQKLFPYLNKAEYIDSNGQGDFFASGANMKLFSQLTPERDNLRIIIETNGTLFSEQNWKKIEHLSGYDITVNITPNSLDRDTYAYLNGGFDLLDTLLENLEFVSRLRTEGKIKKFTLITVIQESNILEIPSFVEKCLQYNVDEVILRPIFKWNFLSEEDHWFKNVANPLHPYYKYYEKLLKSDIFDNPKVYNWGCTLDVEPKMHPAYLYKEIAEMQSRIIGISNCEEKINQFFKDRNISDIIIYGTDILGQTVSSIMNRSDITIGVKDILCRDMLQTYEFDKDDTILITNYYFKDAVTRDIRFKGFTGTIITLNEMVEAIE